MLRKISITALLLVFFGLVVLPMLAYAVGQIIIGPYEGTGGLFGYMRTIVDALADQAPSAILLVSSPLAIGAVWVLIGWALRRGDRQAAHDQE